MAKVAEPLCVPTPLRKRLVDMVSGISMSTSARTTFTDQLETIPDCENGEQPVAQKRKGGKRAPSAYNAYMSTCLKSPEMKKVKQQTDRMSKCASGWRKQKETSRAK